MCLGFVWISFIQKRLKSLKNDQKMPQKRVKNDQNWLKMTKNEQSEKMGLYKRVMNGW